MKKIIFNLLIVSGVQSIATAQGSNYRSGEFIRVSQSDSLQHQLPGWYTITGYSGPSLRKSNLLIPPPHD